MPRVRPVERKDAAAWPRLRRALWPESAEDEHDEELEQFFSGCSHEPLAVLIAADQTDTQPGNTGGMAAHRATGFTMRA